MAFSTFTFARSFSSFPVMNAVLKNITVIGSGPMGTSIAQVAAQTGHKVTLVDHNEPLLKYAATKIKLLIRIDRMQTIKFSDSPEEDEKFISESFQRLKTTTSTGDSVKEADIVIETSGENMKEKHELFKALDKAAPPSTLFASTAPYLSITEIASVTNRKDRCGGLHFFHPVSLTKLIEVIRTAETSDDTYNKMMEFGENLRKHTITCKDTPGFVVNRLLVPYMKEAVAMVERGDATAEDIDTAMILGARSPGPFLWLDSVGLDATKFIIDGWHEKFPEDPLFKPPELLKKVVSEGRLGKKIGEAFLKH